MADNFSTRQTFPDDVVTRKNDACPALIDTTN